MNPIEENHPNNDASSNSAEETKMNFTHELWDWTKSILMALAIVFIIHQFVFNLSKVEGHSMEPTLVDKERLFVNKISLMLKEPTQGNIVILKHPRGGEQFLVKRIIGVPGDTIEIRNQQLFINGQLMEESYTASPIEGRDFGPLIVDQDHYFVMGDNRFFGESLDSRDFGVVPSNLIKGRAEFILWPVMKFEKL